MAARFWVGGTGNWDAADTTHWSASSGGAGGASVPGASDDVTFDGSSGGGAVTVTATQSVLSITGGAHTGTLNTNGQTITVGSGGFNYSGTGTRTLTLGASSITVTAAISNAWNFSTTTNLTFNCNTSTITLTGANSTINGGLQTFYTVVMDGSGTQQISSGVTFTNLTITGDTSKTHSVLIGSTQTITGTLTINGNSSTNRVLFASSAFGTARVVTAANVSASNADFRDITGAGAASWDLSAITGLSGDCGGNTNITFTTAATQTYTGGTDNWSSVAKWTSRVPLPQDDVSMSGVTGGTITADMPRLGKSIDWTGASGGPTFAVGSVAVTSYGSLTWISGMSFSVGGSTHFFEGRTTGMPSGGWIITSVGKQYNNTYNFQGPGTFQLADAISTTANIRQGAGSTFTSNGYALTSLVYSMESTNTINLSSSTYTLTNTATGTIWTGGGTTNSGTSTIIITNVGGNPQTFAGAGKTYNALKIAGGGAGAVIITGANTFNRIYTDGGGTKSITLPGSTTTTILSGQGLGNGTNVITFTASAGSATISKANGIVEWDYVNLTNIPSTGGATFYAGANSTDGGGNTNWIFTAYSGGAGTENLTKSGMNAIIHTDSEKMLNYWLKQQGWVTTATAPTVPPSLEAL